MTAYHHIISATEASRSLSNILNKVHYQGESFEIKRGKLVIARLIPVSPHSTRLLVSELNDLFAHAPNIDEKEALQFQEDIKKIRAHMKPEADPWA